MYEEPPRLSLCQTLYNLAEHRPARFRGSLRLLEPLSYFETAARRILFDEATLLEQGAPSVWRAVETRQYAK